MKRARVMVLGIALTAALGAAWIAKKIVSGPREVETVEKTVGSTDVLVAATAINLGDSVTTEDLKWQQWPVEGVTPGLITRSGQPDAPTQLAGAVARAPFIAGEPIKEQKLIKISEGGVMAAILPAGMRAISTPIREETSAGGFILPNDRVDVILSHKIQVGTKEEPVSEAVLRNVRVLAIGQEIENKDGEKVATGKTATLELTPRADGASRSGAVDGRDLAFLAQSRRRDPRTSRAHRQDRRRQFGLGQVSEIRRAVARLRHQLRRPDKQ